MIVSKTIQETKKTIKEWKAAGASIGFVPTMGFLHEGHLSLINHASENDKVIVSIFVNPIQFGQNEDLDKYPRDFENDRKLCETAGVDMIFYPEVSEMYGDGFSTFVDMKGPSDELCGLSRPGHFRGVCTVVNKLLNIITPDIAYFGQKDAQQLAVIKHMVDDLNMSVKVVSVPIVREKDGLAKSSRNKYLNQKEKEAALILSKTINLAKQIIKDGETDTEIIIEEMTKNITTEKLAKIDYLKIVDAYTIEPIEIIDRPILVAMAVYFGNTRLIDNFTFNPNKN